MKPFTAINNPRNIRHKLGQNQQKFWSCIGVTQSGGSRYESGRAMPKPVRELLRLVHVEGVDLSKVSGTDLRVAEELRKSNPALYTRLKDAARKRAQRQ